LFWSFEFLGFELDRAYFFVFFLALANTDTISVASFIKYFNGEFLILSNPVSSIISNQKRDSSASSSEIEILE